MKHNKNPKRIIEKQNRFVAPDYPFFAVTLYKCTCGCDGYATVLTKLDIGYVKNILDIEYDNPLEALIKFKQLSKKCEGGEFDVSRTLGAGTAFE